MLHFKATIELLVDADCGSIHHEQLQPDLFDTLKELRSATTGFRGDAYKREPLRYGTRDRAGGGSVS